MLILAEIKALATRAIFAVLSRLAAFRIIPATPILTFGYGYYYRYSYVR